MWIVKWILGALLIILILGFAFQNQHQVAHVNVWNWTSPEMPLYLIVYFGFSLGLLTWLFVSIFKILQLKVECRQLNKQNELLTGCAIFLLKKPSKLICQKKLRTNRTCHGIFFTE